MESHHKRVHLLIKPSKRYTCHECEISFEQNKKMVSHLNRVHLNDRPYKCNLCEKSYFNDPVLKRHIQIIHKGETK